MKHQPNNEYNDKHWSGITKDAVDELRKQKWTYQRIADKYNVTRQRVHQIVTGYKPGDGVTPAEERQPKFFKLLPRGTVKCGHCGKEFPALLSRKYCSFTCAVEGRRVYKNRDERRDALNKKQRDRHRARYHADPEYRELCRQSHIRWYHSTRVDKKRKKY